MEYSLRRGPERHSSDLVCAGARNEALEINPARPIYRDKRAAEPLDEALRQSLVEAVIPNHVLETKTMTVVRYEPWNALNQLHSQLNRLFDREFTGRELDSGAASSAATADWIPPADIEEYADRFVLKLDVPGV